MDSSRLRKASRRLWRRRNSQREQSLTEQAAYLHFCDLLLCQVILTCHWCCQVWKGCHPNQPWRHDKLRQHGQSGHGDRSCFWGCQHQAQSITRSWKGGSQMHASSCLLTLCSHWMLSLWPEAVASFSIVNSPLAAHSRALYICIQYIGTANCQDSRRQQAARKRSGHALLFTSWQDAAAWNHHHWQDFQRSHRSDVMQYLIHLLWWGASLVKLSQLKWMPLVFQLLLWRSDSGKANWSLLLRMHQASTQHAAWLRSWQKSSGCCRCEPYIWEVKFSSECWCFVLVNVSWPCGRIIGCSLLQEGVSPTEMDKKTKQIGFPVGSATLVDEVGIDVSAHIASFLSESFGSRFGFSKEETGVLNDMVAKGFLGKSVLKCSLLKIRTWLHQSCSWPDTCQLLLAGRKSGKGIFLYDNAGQSKGRSENPGAADILKQHLVDPKLE